MEYVYIYLGSVVITSLWLAFEMWRAPLLDDNHKTIIKEKTFVDLLKKFKLWKKSL